MNLDYILYGLITFLISLMIFISDKPRSWKEKKAGPPDLSDLDIKEGYWLGLVGGLGLIIYGLFG